MTETTVFSRGVAVKARAPSIEFGALLGTQRCCQMEGCRGRRLYVRWPSGKITIPCTKGMAYNDTSGYWEIL